MISYITNNKLQLIGIHLLIGFLMTVPFLTKIYGFIVVILCLVLLVASSNRNEEALLLSFYVAGSEVFIRMIGGFISYETGKYLITLLLLIGLFMGQSKNKISISFILYFLMLLLGIIFTRVPEGESIRKAIVFNLSGPLVLGISAIYFYQRPITKKELFNALFLGSLPLFSMVVYLFFRTPDLKEIAFGGVANFATSGGFGPNQVATAIGLGIFILGVFLLLKVRLTGFVWLDSFFLIYFVYRGLLTLSRGGLITGFFSLIVFAFFYFLSQRKGFTMLIKYTGVSAVLMIGVWLYTSDVTGGMLDNRYTGRNARGVKKADITTGRLDIMKKQYESFVEHPLGIGVGNGKFKRQMEGEHVTAASHNEVGRLIEEHGFFGLIILLQLLLTPLGNFLAGTNFQRAFIISFFLLWFLTINHSAMRIAFPGFIYGLSLIRIVNND